MRLKRKYRSENDRAKSTGHCFKEYWSARPGNKWGSTPGRWRKRLTHSIERLLGNRDTKKQQDEAIDANT